MYFSKTEKNLNQTKSTIENKYIEYELRNVYDSNVMSC